MALKKNLSIKLLILMTFFLVISFSGCFSHWQGGDLAKIVISFGGAGRYSADDTEIHEQLEHKVVLTNARNTLNFSFKGKTTLEAYAPPGNWTVWVYSWQENGEIYAAGTINTDLQAGQNNVIPINMYQAHLVTFNSMGGSAVPYQVVIDGEYATKPKPTRTVYTLDGWYTDEKFTGESFNFNESITQSITLYAKWIAFEVPGGTLEEKLTWLKNKAVHKGGYIVRVNEGGEEIGSANWLGYDNKEVTITLTGGGTVTLNDVTNPYMFNIGPKVTLILEDIILKGHADTSQSPLVNVNGKLIMKDHALITGHTTDTEAGVGGGGVHVSSGGYFRMEGGTISKNKNTGYGSGGVNVWRGKFEMTGGTISENTADSDGGGVNVGEGGTFNMSGGIISGNTVANSGGGVFVSDGATFTMETTSTGEGGTIFGNTAGNEGGGVYIGNGTFTMHGGDIYDNTANGYGGGGVKMTGGIFTMNGGTIQENHAPGIEYEDGSSWSDGGGVYVWNGTFTMTGGKIYNNDAIHGGGVGVRAESNNVGVSVQGKFTMTGGEIHSNTAISNGGGVSLAGAGATFTMKNGNIYKNKAEWGGGVHIVDDVTFTMTGGEISSNETTQGGNGGGVMVGNNGKFTMTGGDIFSNKAIFRRDENNYESGGDGGGVHIGEGGTFNMGDGVISRNTAGGNGGGVFIWFGDFTKTGGTIYGLNGEDNKNESAYKSQDISSGYSSAIFAGIGIRTQSWGAEIELTKENTSTSSSEDNLSCTSTSKKYTGEWVKRGD